MLYVPSKCTFTPSSGLSLVPFLMLLNRLPESETSPGLPPGRLGVQPSPADVLGEVLQVICEEGPHTHGKKTEGGRKCPQDLLLPGTVGGLVRSPRGLGWCLVLDRIIFRQSAGYLGF